MSNLYIYFLFNKFTYVTDSHWKISNNRRIFFTDFAQTNNFDPLNPVNWYSVERKDILATKVCLNGKKEIVDIFF